MDRREFLAKAGLLVTWAAIPITITECSKSSKGATQPSNGDISGVVSVSVGHSHSVVLTKVEITAGNAVDLTLTGGTHTHTVSLTAQDVGDIGQGLLVAHPSTNTNGHTHTVTFN
jgi:hypothetical protein